MSALRNTKHEMFAQEIAKGTSAARAYVLAGFKENRHNAASLARDQHIVTRVQHILAETADMEREATEKAADALSIDKQWVMARLMENAADARANGDYAPSNKALELLGKQLGMFKEQVQASGDFTMRWMSTGDA